MKYNFPQHINGDTFNGVTFTVSVNAVPLNLTDATIKMQARTQSGALALELTTTDNEIEITTPLSGIFSIKEQIITVTDPAKFNYDIQITLSDGTIKTYIEGTWQILPSVTR